MTLNSDDPTSLKGYDMVISISEEAINRQLELLYWTKVRKPLVATDSALSGSPPPSKYLINHDLSIHLKKPDGRINRWEGIEGHIEPPTVSFTNLWGPTAKISEEVRNKMDKKMDFCSVRIFIKFKDDLSLPKGKTEVDDTRGSYFQYVDFEDDPNTGRPIAEPKKISLTGYTMSWVAKLARTDIVDVMKNLIEPAKDESLPDYLPNNIKEEWTKWSKEDNRVFLVSSLWCLFNKDEIVESFELRNADGLLDDKLEGVASIFITAVSRHFSGIKGNENGLPTADNPFVLGYGISQQVPSVTQVVDGQVIYPPPEFLQAKNCHISTTPSPGSPVNGTLNFCMETYRKPPRHVDPISDVKAGKFAINDTLFRASKTNSGDGVLALSQDIFMKHFVQETLAPEMFLDPQSMLSEYLKPWMDKPIAYLNIPKGYLSYVTKKETPNATSYTHRVDFRTCGVQQEGTVAWYGADYIEGFSSVNIVVSSDLMANKEHAVLPADYKRRVFIDVDIRCDFWSKYWIMPKGLLDDAEIFHDVKVPPGWLEAKRHPSFIEAATLYGPKEGFWKKGASFKNIVRDTIDVVTGIPGIGKPAGSKVPEWSQKRSSHVDVAYRVRYILEPSEGGAWLISIDEEATNLPKTEQVSNNEPRAVVEDGDRNGRWGAFVKSEEDDWFWKHLSPGHYLTTFHTYIKDQVSVNGITALANRMGNSFNKMRSTVFLPAGNVFQFFGLDVDESGRMFSHLGYAEGAANGTQTGDPQGPVLVKK